MRLFRHAATLLAALTLTVGLAACQPPNSFAPKDKFVAFDVYLYTGATDCGCPTDIGNITPDNPNLSHATTLLRVDYGFIYGPQAKHDIASTTAVPTPFHTTRVAPVDAISATMYAQAADATAILVCALYEGELFLVAIVGAGDGTVSCSTDLD